MANHIAQVLALMRASAPLHSVRRFEKTEPEGAERAGEPRPLREEVRKTRCAARSPPRSRSLPVQPLRLDRAREASEGTLAPSGATTGS